ncbi:hypothetical protein CCR87_00620 [Rhodobaculum claviforme]|uniref:tRNA A-37 threonylcarbamoyl transferase component Bud32 n=1 Tax=Rhodobaculum claviforme TaxID=1549854 RepID=A0A934WHU1_9RHOB|nr:hypothetical protein [Rhodobaculum claviforme]
MHAVDPEGRRRVVAVQAGDRRIWVKRPERLTLRLRLQKGSSDKSFAREAVALHELSGRGLPVAELVAATPGLLAVADCGEPLRTILRDPARPADERARAARAGGAALAALHGAGVAHGRPDLRDICWDGSRATLIDFERYTPGPASVALMRTDLVIMVFAAVVALGPDAPELAALCAGYRRAAPPEPWQAAARLARGLARVAPLLRLLAPLDGKRGEIAAVAPTLRVLIDPPADGATDGSADGTADRLADPPPDASGNPRSGCAGAPAAITKP